nr:hypothetical protein GCM10020093_067380 [Planobispora longispora]
MDEREYLAAYDPRAYPAIAVTVDVVALTIIGGVLHVLLVERGNRPSWGGGRCPAGSSGPERIWTRPRPGNWPRRRA